MKLFVAVLVSALAAECPAKPAPAPLGDAAAPPAGGSCASACARLYDLACPEGRALNCVQTCEHAPALKTDMHVACLASARTKAEARACRSVACPE